MKLRILIAALIVTALVLGVYFFVHREERTPITDLVGQIAKETDATKKKVLVDALGKLQPSKGIEYKVMGQSKEGEVRKALLQSISKAKRFSPSWLKLVDENPQDLQLMEAVATAIAGLRDSGDVPALIDLLEDRALSNRAGDGLMVEGALAALGEIRDDRAIEPMLKRDELFFQHMGASSLAKFGVKALPRLVEIAENKNDKRWRHAAATISQITDMQAIPELMELARRSDNNAEIRVNAVKALSRMKAKEAEPVIQKLLNDSDTGVQVAVSEVLIGSGDKLLQDIVVKKLPDYSEYPVVRIIHTLDDHGDVTHVKEISPYLTSPDSELRHAAMSYVAKADYEKHFPQLLEMLKDQSWAVREEALKIFRSKKETRAVPYAEALLQDQNDWVRFAAAKMLQSTTNKSYPYKKNAQTKDLESMDVWKNQGH